jgi:hypothetical protein
MQPGKCYMMSSTIQRSIIPIENCSLGYASQRIGNFERLNEPIFGIGLKLKVTMIHQYLKLLLII